MCEKTKGLHNRIDKCIKPLIDFLNKGGIKTLACCCGHGKYPLSIVTEHYIDEDSAWEILSKTKIPRKKKFYKKDKQGYYYIPEVVKEKKNGNK